ncbi:MAG: SCO family protein [Elusimicrobia bacterium]|nr:SCO family protein [Elusimicrobiota bacterium]
MRAKLVLSAVGLGAAGLFAAALLAPRLGGPLPRLSAPVEFEAPGLSAGSLRGRPWVADFVFTSCAGPCPTLSANMARLQKRLPAAVALVSFSVDPETDTREVLAEYAGRLGAEPGRWFFARLEPGPLYRLVNAGFHLPVFIDPEADSGSRAIHTTKFVLVDADGAVRGYYDGMSESGLRQLERDAARLLREGPAPLGRTNV